MVVVVDLSLVILYFVIVIVIGIVSAKRENAEEFLIAERKLGAWNIAASISAGFIGGGAIVAYVAYVYQFGMAAMWFFIGLALGFLLLLLYHKKIKEMSDKEKFYTISDYFKFKYGKNVGMMSAFVILLYSLFLVLIELIAGGRILSDLLGISYYWAVLLGALVVLFYLSLGGFKSVIKTDFFQYIVMIVFVAIIAIFLINGTQIPVKELALSGAGWMNTIAFFVLGIFTTIIAPDLWQRMYAAKNTKTVKISFYITAISLLIFSLLITLIGIIAKINYSGIEPSDALVYGFSHLLPAGLLGLGLVMLFAAIMSTLDSYLFVLGMNISEDVVTNYKRIDKKQLIKITRWSIIGFTIFSVLISLLVQNIITVALAFGSISMALVPALIGSFHFKLKNKAVFLSILAGTISVFAILLSGYITPGSSVISLPVSLIFLILGQIFFKK